MQISEYSNYYNFQVVLQRSEGCQEEVPESFLGFQQGASILAVFPWKHQRSLSSGEWEIKLHDFCLDSVGIGWIWNP